MCVCVCVCVHMRVQMVARDQEEEEEPRIWRSHDVISSHELQPVVNDSLGGSEESEAGGRQRRRDPYSLDHSSVSPEDSSSREREKGIRIGAERGRERERETERERDMAIERQQEAQKERVKMKEREQAREDELFRPRSVAGSFSSEVCVRLHVRVSVCACVFVLSHLISRERRLLQTRARAHTHTHTHTHTLQHGGRHALSQSWFKKKLLAESSEGSDEDPQAQSRQEASSFSSPRRQNAASFSSPRKSVASQKPRQHTSEASPPKEKEPGSPKQTRTGSFNGKPVSRPGSFGASFGGTFARAQALTSTTADKWNAEPHDDIVRPQLATLQPQNPSPSPTAPAATAPAPETSAPAPAPAPAQEVQVVDVGELGEWLPSEVLSHCWPKLENAQCCMLTAVPAARRN